MQLEGSTRGIESFQTTLQIKSIVGRNLISEWRKKENCDSKNQIEHIKMQMAAMQEEGGIREWETWNDLKKQLDVAYEEEGEYWSQM